MLNLGNGMIKDLFLGEKKVTAAYLGTVQVYPNRARTDDIAVTIASYKTEGVLVQTQMNTRVLTSVTVNVTNNSSFTATVFIEAGYTYIFDLNPQPFGDPQESDDTAVAPIVNRLNPIVPEPDTGDTVLGTTSVTVLPRATQQVYISGRTSYFSDSDGSAPAVYVKYNPAGDDSKTIHEKIKFTKIM